MYSRNAEVVSVCVLLFEFEISSLITSRLPRPYQLSHAPSPVVPPSELRQRMATAGIAGPKPYASLTSKELVMSCMDFVKADKEGGMLGMTVKGFTISCLCCRYRRFATTKQGFTNNANHFKACTKESGERVYLDRVAKAKAEEEANLLAEAEDAANCDRTKTIWRKSECVCGMRKLSMFVYCHLNS